MLFCRLPARAAVIADGRPGPARRVDAAHFRRISRKRLTLISRTGPLACQRNPLCARRSDWPSSENFETRDPPARRVAGRDRAASEVRLARLRRRSRASPPLLSVIVPVYEDFAATRACFEALFAQGRRIAMRIIAVDDASPNADLRAWLDASGGGGPDQSAAQRAKSRLRRLRQPRSELCVRRATSCCSTPTPCRRPGSLARLARSGAFRAGHRHGRRRFPTMANIPAFRRPMSPIRWRSPAEVARIDILAHKANGFDFVDLPNGIGFCLYHHPRLSRRRRPAARTL